MRILLGLGRWLAFLYVLWSASVAVGCDQLPLGQTLWVRLASPISTYSAHVGDPLRAVLTQDVACGVDVVLPMGTSIEGVVRGKRKVGWGIRHETAALEIEFTHAVIGDGSAVELSARVEEVENAREQVKNGVVQGVLSSDTFQGRINSRLIHLPTWNPYSDLGLIVYKATFPIFPEPEIYYPAGTDLRLKTKTLVESLPITGTTLQDNDTAGSSQLDAWVQQMPRRSTTTKSVNADLVNLVFLGSREQVQAAFLEAGWHNSDPVSRYSFGKNLYALLNNSGYAQQPMTTLSARRQAAGHELAEGPQQLRASRPFAHLAMDRRRGERLSVDEFLDARYQRDPFGEVPRLRAPHCALHRRRTRQGGSRS